MNILFAASEVTPYAKTGGLGDVLAALPAVLRARGHSVSVVVPLYRELRESLKELAPTELSVKVEMEDGPLPARIWEGVTRDGVTLFAVERDEFFDRGSLYGTDSGDYFDNAARFIFFCKAVVGLAECLEPLPEILHANDWQTALIPGLVRAWQLPYKTVLTIHNLAYQGIFPARSFDAAGLGDDFFQPHTYEYYGRLNLLKGGILLADSVTTVSPNYAREIQEEEFGCGLNGALTARAGDLTGILNGIDADLWNPESDSWIEANYSAENPGGKQKCKEALLAEFGLEDASKPLFGCVSRLAEQKGFDLILSVLPTLLDEGARFILLGSGDSALEDRFRQLALERPGQVAVQIGFDEKLAHRIEAGCDLFLMPSRFEPCGLNQFYSMRYGTVPVVHDVGGLSDSVQDGGTGADGFKFQAYTPESFLGAIRRALAAFEKKAAWQQLQKNGMSRNDSWDSRVPFYEKVYHQLIG